VGGLFQSFDWKQTFFASLSHSLTHLFFNRNQQTNSRLGRASQPQNEIISIGNFHLLNLPFCLLMIAEEEAK